MPCMHIVYAIKLKTFSIKRAHLVFLMIQTKLFSKDSFSMNKYIRNTESNL